MIRDKLRSGIFSEERALVTRSQRFASKQITSGNTLKPRILHGQLFSMWRQHENCGLCNPNNTVARLLRMRREYLMLERAYRNLVHRMISRRGWRFETAVQHALHIRSQNEARHRRM